MVVGAFVLFGAGLAYQFAVLSDALAAGYPPDISGHLTRDFDRLARMACLVGGALLVLLLPMMLRGWRGSGVVTFVLAVLFVALGALLRTPLLVAGAVAAIVAVLVYWARPSPAATTHPASPARGRSRP